MSEGIRDIYIDLPLFHSGKIREVYHVPSDILQPPLLCVVATDRLSTHNVVHRTAVPLKGEILTALTIFWVKKILEPHKIPHHVVTYGRDIYNLLPKDKTYPKDLHVRALVVKMLNMVSVEFIWRHYLTGSLYKKYYARKVKNPYGIYLRSGLKNMSFLETPIFTPTDKSEIDEPILAKRVMWNNQEEFLLTQKVYKLCREYALSMDVDIIDTKLECGEGIIADEIVTPDSSRFARVSDIKEDEDPLWLDKEIFRRDAERQWKDGPKIPLKFSYETIGKGTVAYLELFDAITGMSLHDFQKKYM